MRLGIDASNLRAGGGVTHLAELLRAADPSAHGIDDVIVWAGPSTLAEIADRPWLIKRGDQLLAKSVFHRVFWQRARLTSLVRSAECDVLLVPGGAYTGNFRPFIAMCRNMLPFERSEWRRYGISITAAKLIALGRVQARTFRRATGLVFLTRYARDEVMKLLGNIDGEVAIIPHGVDARFLQAPRKQRPIEEYSTDRPYRILYVSTVDLYKHQWHVAEAVAELRRSGMPVTLDLVGRSYAPALIRLRRTLRRLDPSSEFLRYAGSVPHTEVSALYAQADLCVFVSSCENMPNILLEGMASGLPIVCSNRGPMPEILGDGGIYCDPERPADIAHALREAIDSPQLRARIAARAFERARQYTWSRCASDTLSLIRSLLGDVSARLSGAEAVT